MSGLEKGFTEAGNLIGGNNVPQSRKVKDLQNAIGLVRKYESVTNDEINRLATENATLAREKAELIAQVASLQEKLTRHEFSDRADKLRLAPEDKRYMLEGVKED